MTVVVSHPTGIANVRALLRVLARSKLLDTFWTTIAVPPPMARASIVGSRLQRELGRRLFAEAPWHRIRQKPLRELTRILASRVGQDWLVRHEAGWACVDQVYREVDERVARYITSSSASGVRAVYTYEDGSCATFAAAKERGIRCIYHLPIPHWQKIRMLLREEAELQPAWAPTLEALKDTAQKLARKDQEIALADHVVVASSFTRSSLLGNCPANTKVIVASYGAPAPLIEEPSQRHPDEPLHVFYAGHLAQRKGIAYLIAALQRLEVPWRLTVAGPRPASAPTELDAFLSDERCVWLGHVPHQTLLEEMTRAHVFVFPSLVEGFGMVLYEAMAAGLPVITTPHTAGPDIMTDGREGFIVPIRDPDAITERLTLIYEDEDRRQEIAAAALACAACSGWEVYEARIAELVETAIAL